MTTLLRIFFPSTHSTRTTPMPRVSPNTHTTSVSLPAALWDQLTTHPSYPTPTFPGLSYLLDGAIRTYLRAQGATVPDRAPDVPLHERARRARAAAKAAPKGKGGRKGGAK